MSRPIVRPPDFERPADEEPLETARHQFAEIWDHAVAQMIINSRSGQTRGSLREQGFLRVADLLDL